MRLTGKNKSSLQSTRPGGLYEDVSKLGMGGPPTAIELRECPAYAPTVSGGGQRREEDCIYDN